MANNRSLNNYYLTQDQQRECSAFDGLDTLSGRCQADKKAQESAERLFIQILQSFNVIESAFFRRQWRNCFRIDDKSGRWPVQGRIGQKAH
ncbi:MAG: hypothetical protein WBX22_02950 [Silvibacterium sp.]